MYSEKPKIPWGAILVIGAVLIFGCIIAGSLVARNYFAENNISADLPTTNPNPGATPTAVIVSPDPVFGPNFKADDGLPTYICGADAFGSYFTLQQIQMSGLDVRKGFHLRGKHFQFRVNQRNCNVDLIF